MRYLGNTRTLRGKTRCSDKNTRQMWVATLGGDALDTLTWLGMFFRKVRCVALATGVRVWSDVWMWTRRGDYVRIVVAFCSFCLPPWEKGVSFFMFKQYWWLEINLEKPKNRFRNQDPLISSHACDHKTNKTVETLTDYTTVFHQLRTCHWIQYPLWLVGWAILVLNWFVLF